MIVENSSYLPCFFLKYNIRFSFTEAVNVPSHQSISFFTSVRFRTS